MPDLTQRLRADLTAAMKARDTDVVRVLRVVLGEVANAEAQPVEPGGTTGLTMSGGIAGATHGVGATEVARRELTDDDVRAIIRAEHDERPAEAGFLERYL